MLILDLSKRQLLILLFADFFVAAYLSNREIFDNTLFISCRTTIKSSNCRCILASYIASCLERKKYEMHAPPSFVDKY